MLDEAPNRSDEICAWRSDGSRASAPSFFFTSFTAMNPVIRIRLLFPLFGSLAICSSISDAIWKPAFRMAAANLLGVSGSILAWSSFCASQPIMGKMWLASGLTAIGRGRLHAALDLLVWARWCDGRKWMFSNTLQVRIAGLVGKPALAGEIGWIDGPWWTEEQKGNFKTVAIRLRLDMACFHIHSVHGSFANFSPKITEAFVLNVFADGPCRDTNEPLLEGIPVFKKGIRWKGKLLLDFDRVLWFSISVF